MPISKTDEKFAEDLTKPVTEDNIKHVAKKYHIHPGIVVGRLQKMGELDFSELNKFKQKISLFD